MGSYYGVKKVEEIGERLNYNNAKQPNVPVDKRLIAVIGNGLFKIAPDVTSPSEYDEFYHQYSSGYWLTFATYLLTEDQLKDCPDEGRVDDDFSFSLFGNL